MKRQPLYEWKLRDVMAQHRMFKTTDLTPHLAERGIDLSASQVHRLVTATPERLSLVVLSALCDIFNCEPGELVEVSVAEAAPKKRRAGSNVVDLASTGRPKRARVTDD